MILEGKKAYRGCCKLAKIKFTGCVSIQCEGKEARRMKRGAGWCSVQGKGEELHRYYTAKEVLQLYCEYR